MHLSHHTAAWTADDWTALGTIALVVVALLAALYSKRQLDEARALRFAQGRPNVVIFTEPNPASPEAVDLVMQNFGPTAAHDVETGFEPWPLRLPADEKGETEPQPVAWPKLVSVLAPGQQIRTFWDKSEERLESELPRECRATLSYSDEIRRGRCDPQTFLLDWNTYEGRIWLRVRGLHEIATSTHNINATLNAFREGPGNRRGAAVFVRDGNLKDRREAKQQTETRQQTSALNAMLIQATAPAPLDADEQQ